MVRSPPWSSSFREKSRSIGVHVDNRTAPYTLPALRKKKTGCVRCIRRRCVCLRDYCSRVGELMAFCSPRSVPTDDIACGRRVLTWSARAVRRCPLLKSPSRRTAYLYTRPYNNNTYIVVLVHTFTYYIHILTHVHTYIYVHAYISNVIGVYDLFVNIHISVTNSRRRLPVLRMYILCVRRVLLQYNKHIKVYGFFFHRFINILL